MSNSHHHIDSLSHHTYSNCCGGMALHYDPFWQDQLSMSQYSFAPGYTNAASTGTAAYHSSYYVRHSACMGAKTLGLVVVFGVINV
jgi:hypothetical protein